MPHHGSQWMNEGLPEKHDKQKIVIAEYIV